MNDMPETGAIAIALNPEYEAYFSRYEEQRRRERELRPANRTALFDALVAAGVTMLVVTFDGYGDSGQIEAIEARDGGGEIALPEINVELAVATFGDSEPQRQTLGLREAIENLAYDCLRDTHPGWENSDGAYGDFTFDVASRLVRLDYNERYTASESYSHEL
jgi:hypothetical protein